MLKVSNVNTFYGSLQALRDVSFRVDDKEIITLVRANGAGKTTILKTISNLLHPASGTLEFFDRRIDKLPSYRIIELGISHIPAALHLFPDMTVYENLQLGAHTYQAWKREEEMFEQVYQIFSVLKEKAGQLARFKRWPTANVGYGSRFDVKTKTVHA